MSCRKPNFAIGGLEEYLVVQFWQVFEVNLVEVLICSYKDIFSDLLCETLKDSPIEVYNGCS